MIDRPTERVLHLTRKFGDETILVLIDRPKVPQDDEELVFGIPMGVYVSKDDDGLRLKFGVKAFADEIVIDSVAVQQRRESKWSYQGPDIDDLDENLQKAFNKFLEIRGINPTITDFLADYLANKDKREHLRWLKDVKSFVDILKLSNKSETCK
ncbi:BnaC03g15060D [Brassica napus]|uniref:BnaC03g15060D protein n=4 Tax=Brassica TaxID=3705 RepID=A0A078HPL9_BRANA|nr:BnaC03g15060D [Brassica napus]